MNAVVAIVVQSEPLCHYCGRAESSVFCGRCKRALCRGCYDGLQCAQRKCWPTPSGDRVR